MGKHKITFISDTHGKHDQIVTNKSLRKNGLPLDLPGGDILIHAGDFMNSGWNEMEAIMFFKWFDSIDNYDTKIFIAGNHDRWAENNPEEFKGILTGYKTIEYLQDDWMGIYYDGPNGDMPEENIRIYGSPWSPYFYNWAFNLPRQGVELQEKWSKIPDNTDILICHTMPWGHLDITDNMMVGCELLRFRVDEFKPKIFVGGHIHSGYGYKFDGHTHFFNAAILNNSYRYTNKPMTIEWDSIANTVDFL